MNIQETNSNQSFAYKIDRWKEAVGRRIDKLSNQTSAKILSLIPVVNNIILAIKLDRLNTSLKNKQISITKKTELLNNLNNFCATIEKYESVRLVATAVSTILIIPAFVILPSHFLLIYQALYLSKKVNQPSKVVSTEIELNLISDKNAIRNEMLKIESALQSIKYHFNSKSPKREKNIERNITEINDFSREALKLTNGAIEKVEAAAKDNSAEDEIKDDLKALYKVKEVCEKIVNANIKSDNLGKLKMSLLRADFEAIVKDARNGMY